MEGFTKVKDESGRSSVESRSAGRRSAGQRSVRRWRWAAGLLTLFGFGIGCNPATLTGYLLMPFQPNLPPKCDQMKLEKDSTVAVAAFYGYLEQQPEAQGLERELNERLCAALKKRFESNRQKVNLVPPSRVQAYLNQSARMPDLHELGKHFKADYVIALEVQGVRLYERGVRDLYRGNLNLDVVVFDIKKPSGESSIFHETFRCEYPKNNPVPVETGSSVGQFRAQFLDQVSRQLSRWFTSYPPEEQREYD
jgi:hypothetical protein